MPTTSNTATDVTSSQGVTLIANARKVSIKSSRAGSTSPKLDASTLDLAHGSTRVYEDGLTDNGPNGGSGITVTVTAEGLGSPPPTGDAVSVNGVTCKCTESSSEANVGELAGWSATYSSAAS